MKKAIGQIEVWIDHTGALSAQATGQYGFKADNAEQSLNFAAALATSAKELEDKLRSDMEGFGVAASVRKIAKEYAETIGE